MPLLAWVQANILATLTLVGSVIAFAFTVWAGLFVRKNARINALPLLNSFTRNSPRPAKGPDGQPVIHGELVAQILNGGLGPALVTKYEVYANGALIDTSNRKQIQTLLTTVFGLNPDNAVATWYHFEGVASIPKDGTIPSLSLKFFVPTDGDFDNVVAGLQKLRIRIEYESFYGDEHVFDGAIPPRPPKLSLFCRHKR